MGSYGLGDYASTAEGHAYVHLLRGIRTGALQPNDRLVPDDIAKEIGMSRMPVREALRRLATEGLVVIRPNRGCFVSSFSPRSIEESFLIRSVLEGLAVRLAVPHLSRAAMAELRHRLDLMKIADESETDDWISRHQDFHNYLCSLCGRKELIRQITIHQVSMEPYLRIYLHHAPKSRSAYAVHRALIEVLETRDPILAEQEMRAHVMGTVPLITKFMSAVGNTLQEAPAAARKAVS